MDEGGGGGGGVRWGGVRGERNIYKVTMYFNLHDCSSCLCSAQYIQVSRKLSRLLHKVNIP